MSFLLIDVLLGSSVFLYFSGLLLSLIELIQIVNKEPNEQLGKCRSV